MDWLARRANEDLMEVEDQTELLAGEVSQGKKDPRVAQASLARVVWPVYRVTPVYQAELKAVPDTSSQGE